MTSTIKINFFIKTYAQYTVRKTSKKQKYKCHSMI